MILPKAWHFLRKNVFIFDPLLSLVLLLITAVSVATMYSAAGPGSERLGIHVRNLGIAMLICWAIARLRPQHLMRVAVPLYLVGVALLLGVEFAGVSAKGAKRWLDIGITRIQPSEVMKIAVPMALAWFYHLTRNRWPGYVRHLLAALMLVIPVALVGRQPDLGTAILVGSAGAFTIYFAGLSWRFIFGGMIVGISALPLLWINMKAYQQQRVLTLLDPTADPLGKGFHIIQSTIAVGSGGVEGKGWMKGTQAHLDFIPERTTDFIFSVYAEEFGLIGTGVLLVLYTCLIARGLFIAVQAQNTFARLLAGSMTMIFFTYAFVNIGMVIGILPVVGVPLPFMSYGGTALVTLGLACGFLMCIARQNAIARRGPGYRYQVLG